MVVLCMLFKVCCSAQYLRSTERPELQVILYRRQAAYGHRFELSVASGAMIFSTCVIEPTPAGLQEG